MFPMINIGPVSIQAAGFILIASLFIGLWTTSYFSKNLGTNGDLIENSILLGLIAGLISARVGFVLQNPSALAGNPMAMFSLTPSMLNPSFGIFVSLLAALIFAQKKHLPLWPSLDTLTPFFLFLLAGIHLSNYTTGNGYGLPTELPWGIQLWNETRHPVNLYALFLAAIYLLAMLYHTKAFKTTGFLRSGTLFSLTLSTAGLIALITRAFVSEKSLIGKFDIWQLFGFALLILGIALIYKKSYQVRKHIPVFISLGSNQDPDKNMPEAVRKLEDFSKIRGISHTYKSKDVQKQSDPSFFYNKVIEIDTGLSYNDLRSRLKNIEVDLGREPGNKVDVPIDLDILTHDIDVFITNGNQIPDPNLIKYKYVAIPLKELAPDFRHPASGILIEDIIDQLKDDHKIQMLKEVENGFEA
ncbi:MAG: 2-amino-4-hydroxy-6-hydroxymethyldihydropteridine diphosphokinase [Brevefilum sp.]|nr:2-amino-4-hydroxy-6-hydroxymethyldihydropteridine diphosphokinase [Brevefilum sp.]MDT8380869.1 2-amino-4-hydroxy-6-hydroxymethyldihydropteridine diphosphokinase [Brevefilum sp.]MDW7754867.1 2-amino-4-hydroxy-6-hydroxymethyldihydropteridine diphosphokinase [Brevefilum sp.]